MSPKPLQLLSGAVFVADAHYSTRHPELLDFLKAIHEGRTPATQLILMGDIFDLLFGPIPYTCQRNAEVVSLIRAIASTMEVIYLEGNHDFQLSALFPEVTVIPLQHQPVETTFEGQRVWLAHGDWDGGLGYRVYTALIRSRIILALLRGIDSLTGHGIIHRLDRYLQGKEDCHTLEGFEAHVERRFEGFDEQNAAWFMEGHFHQNRLLVLGGMRYFNLGAFACNQRYYELQSISEPLKERVFDKES